MSVGKERPVLEKMWYKVTFYNPPYAKINPGGINRFEFSTIDDPGAEELVGYFALRFRGFDPHETIVYLDCPSPPSPPEIRQ